MKCSACHDQGAKKTERNPTLIVRQVLKMTSGNGWSNFFYLCKRLLNACYTLHYYYYYFMIAWLLTWLNFQAKKLLQILEVKTKQSHLCQGCQLRHFSLKSQTICYTADFPTTFLYMLKTPACFTSLHKTTSKHPRIPVSYSIL